MKEPEREVYMSKIIFFLLGVFFFVLGCVGVVIPIIPQIPFFIIAIICFAKTSTRVKKKVLSSKIFNSFAFKKLHVFDRMKKLIEKD